MISVISADPYGYSGGAQDDETDNIIVSTAPITLTGGWVYGTEGDDLFVSAPERQVFEALGGNDTLIAGTALDVYLAGDGFDLVDYSNLDIGLTISVDGPPGANMLLVEEYDLYAPYDPYSPYRDRGLIDGAESLIATDFDDQIYIAEAQITEVLAGGNDLVLGSFGNDIIDAGAGDDRVAGLFGDDLLILGDGADFVFVDREAGAAGGTTGHGNDIVQDFNPFEDVLLVEYDADVETYDPFADLTQTADGALLSMADDSSILLLGVDVMYLNEFNLGAIPEDGGLVYY